MAINSIRLVRRFDFQMISHNKLIPSVSILVDRIDIKISIEGKYPQETGLQEEKLPSCLNTVFIPKMMSLGISDSTPLIVAFSDAFYNPQ